MPPAHERVRGFSGQNGPAFSVCNAGLHDLIMAVPPGVRIDNLPRNIDGVAGAGQTFKAHVVVRLNGRAVRRQFERRATGQIAEHYEQRRMHDARVLTTTAVTGQVRPNRLNNTFVELFSQLQFQRGKPVARVGVMSVVMSVCMK